MAIMDPEPALVPVNVTEHLVTPEMVDRVQVGELRLPPVVPAVSVNVTVPAGALEAVVVSATVAVTEAVQLVPPNAMLQLTFPTLVEVLSLVTACVTVAPWIFSDRTSPMLSVTSTHVVVVPTLLGE